MVCKMLEKIELAKSVKGFNARHVFRMLRSKFRNLRNALAVGEANDITWCSASLAATDKQWRIKFHSFNVNLICITPLSININA